MVPREKRSKKRRPLLRRLKVDPGVIPEWTWHGGAVSNPVVVIQRRVVLFQQNFERDLELCLSQAPVVVREAGEDYRHIGVPELSLPNMKDLIAFVQNISCERVQPLLQFQ